ncbi:hypothetical protein CCAN2_1160013 [Capnocytophaga canimorsus]|nr:hypothetical protein CCAN2_1160013 [Capnocytophaga canimorsus]
MSVLQVLSKAESETEIIESFVTFNTEEVPSRADFETEVIFSFDLDNDSETFSEIEEAKFFNLLNILVYFKMVNNKA